MKVFEYFSSFDKSIVDLKVEEMKSSDDKRILKIDAGHKIEGPDEIKYIPF